MDRVALAVLLIGLVVLAVPVVYFGELKTWRHEEPAPGPGQEAGVRPAADPFAGLGSAPTFHWTALTLGGLTFTLAMGGGLWFWGKAFARSWSAFTRHIPGWAIGLALAPLAILAYILWVSIGLLGGIIAAALVFLPVYLTSRGVLFPTAARQPRRPATPPSRR